MNNSDEYRKARQYALNRLAALPYHSTQLHKLMIKKLFNEADIKKIIQECVELGFLNDREWVESYVRGHSNSHSKRLIIAKLRSKGISLEDIPLDQVSEKEAVQQLIKKRYRSKNLQDRNDRQKVIGSLMRKGFSYDVIKESLQEVEDPSE